MVAFFVAASLRLLMVRGRYDDDPVLKEDLLIPFIVPVLFVRTDFF